MKQLRTFHVLNESKIELYRIFFFFKMPSEAELLKTRLVTYLVARIHTIRTVVYANTQVNFARLDD